MFTSAVSSRVIHRTLFFSFFPRARCFAEAMPLVELRARAAVELLARPARTLHSDRLLFVKTLALYMYTLRKSPESRTSTREL